MKNSIVLLAVLIAIVVPAGAAPVSPDFQPGTWMLSCGGSPDEEISGPVDRSCDRVAENTSRLTDEFVAEYGNEPAYIIFSRPFHSAEERIDRYWFSISPSGMTESFTRISGGSGQPAQPPALATCREFLSGTATSASPNLLQAFHSVDDISEERGELRARDTITRDYPGIARVCMVNSVYRNADESDSRHDYFVVDSQTIIVPCSGNECTGPIKNRAFAITFSASRDPGDPSLIPNSWTKDPWPETAVPGTLMNTGAWSDTDPWYENYPVPFGSSITLSSPEPDTYTWQETAGFFSRYASRPVGISPSLQLVVNETGARDSAVHRLASLQFNGTRSWYSTGNWAYREFPEETSFFGLDYTFRWSGIDSQPASP